MLMSHLKESTFLQLQKEGDSYGSISLLCPVNLFHQGRYLAKFSFNPRPHPRSIDRIPSTPGLVSPLPVPIGCPFSKPPVLFNLGWPSLVVKSSSNLSKLPCFLAGQKREGDMEFMRKQKALKAWWMTTSGALREKRARLKPRTGSTVAQSGSFIIIIYCFSEVLPNWAICYWSDRPLSFHMFLLVIIAVVDYLAINQQERPYHSCWLIISNPIRIRIWGLYFRLCQLWIFVGIFSISSVN